MPTPFTCDEIRAAHKSAGVYLTNTLLNANEGVWGTSTGRRARGKVRRAERACRSLQRARSRQGECSGCKRRYFGSDGCDAADRNWRERESGKAEVLRAVRSAILRGGL